MIMQLLTVNWSIEERCGNRSLKYRKISLKYRKISFQLRENLFSINGKSLYKMEYRTKLNNRNQLLGTWKLNYN